MAKFGIEQNLTRLIQDAAENLIESSLGKAASLGFDVCLDIPKDLSHGDFTTNIAMRLTRQLKKNPMVIAEEIIKYLQNRFKDGTMDGLFEGVTAIKPGFINFKLSKTYLYETLRDIVKKDADFGRSEGGKDKVLIEFVSANPTGPLTVAHGRQAAIGDALARILDFYGNNVTKEYLINDEGRQINVLGESILYHYLGFYGVSIGFPEGGYEGDYIKTLAVEIKEEYGDKFKADPEEARTFFSEYGVKRILNMIKEDLNEFGVNFNSWFSQRSLTNENVREVLDEFRKNGYVYDKDGAEWFKSTEFGDTKDRVVVKSDGAYTYFAPDIAYHKDKFSRGYQRLINIWGPDHHGYIPRLKAACEALGYKKDSVLTLIVQLASLYRDGEALSMSTRKGEFITLKEVMDEVGKDVTRFFFLMRKLDSHLDFDLEVAKRQSSDNPVYYIQYAHARIWSIKDFADRYGNKYDLREADLSLLTEPEELELARIMSGFPFYVRDSAVNAEPYYIIMYLNKLASSFHTFYTKHKVVTDNNDLSLARHYLIECVRICLANGLNLLGVSLPKKM